MPSSSDPLTALAGVRAGFRRVLGAPLLVIGLALFNLAAALPAALVVSSAVDRSIGHSRVNEAMRTGFDVEWYGEYSGGASGLAGTLKPSLVGAGAFYENLDGWLTGKLFDVAPVVALIGAAYGLIWIWLLGGVLMRIMRPGGLRGPRAFIRNATSLFFRMLRLAVVAVACYGLVYVLAYYLRERIDEVSRDVTAETTVFIYHLIVWALTAFLLTTIHMSFNYAKAATVLEERRSMVLAALRGFGFVVLHPARTLGLYYTILGIGALALGAYALVAPGVEQTTPLAVALTFAVGQIFLVGRLFLKLSLLAGQGALYGGALTAAEPRLPIEPDEPSI